MKNSFTIKDLENISGVKAHTIRIWEKRYSLFEPNRSETNVRSYSQDSLKKLLNVVLLIESGLKISKVAGMTDADITLKSRELIFQDLIDLNKDAIKDFKLAMFNFDKDLFNHTYSSLLKNKTFRQIFKEIFVPFTEYVGFLWQTGSIQPIHENFISNLIIQKIQLNISKLNSMVTDDSVTNVLFLPQNEMNDISLLYLDYELSLRGFKTIYLGKGFSLSNMCSFLEDSNNKLRFITSLTMLPEDRSTLFFNQADQFLKDSPHELVAFGFSTGFVKSRDFFSSITIYDTFKDCLDTF